MKWAVDKMKWHIFLVSLACFARSTGRDTGSTATTKKNQITVFKQFVIKIYWTDSQIGAQCESVCVCVCGHWWIKCVENGIHLSWLEDILQKFTFKFAWYIENVRAHLLGSWRFSFILSLSRIPALSQSLCVRNKKYSIRFVWSIRFPREIWPSRFLFFLCFFFLRNESHNCHSWFKFSNKLEATIRRIMNILL